LAEPRLSGTRPGILASCAAACLILSALAGRARAGDDAVRGAALPYVEYEAEDGKTDGSVLGPSRTWGDVAAEASGRRCVRLEAAGQALTITALSAANSIVVRYSIPDAPQGGGIDATLSLFVNGSFVRELDMTSRYSWNYGSWRIPYSKNPADGRPFHYFDECRALLPAGIPAGASVALVKGPADTAQHYDIDLIDLEQVPGPLPEPAGCLSVTDTAFGARGDGVADDGPALQACIAAAEAKGMGVWIPAGTWLVKGRGLEAHGVDLRGAGMWHTTLKVLHTGFRLSGDGNKFRDFSILGDTVNRSDPSPDNGFDGPAGDGSLIENVWVEHTKCGYWVAGGGHGTHGLVIRGCRFRDTYADGVNFFGGTSGSTITECSARNTGDDAFASWSPSWSAPNTGNVFSHNTVQSPWRANCFAVYAGTDTSVEDNVGVDSVDYPGMLLGAQFQPKAFGGTTRVLRNSLIRCGGFFNGDPCAALWISAREGDVAGLKIEDLLIDSPTYAGIGFSGTHTIGTCSLSKVSIQSPGTWGIQVLDTAHGGAQFSDTSVRGSSQGMDRKGDFHVWRGPGNSGW
jgi:hypothetical protein